ncbi:MAG: polyprenyl synthetase family protein [Chloroflexi bacterium]|nr:MAG: polyprenyl synthetase family protein [Chloroflexota bacterium]TMC70593.1 MAG: polyprenyl synthetase family protein [Chloroflexota bacterium]
MADLFAAGGKRIRPALVLLIASCGRYDLAKLTPAAIAVELTHAATLVHDDVIDRAQVRRGRPTVAAQLGDEPAIVVGDFYFAKAYEQAAFTDSPEVVAILARAVMDICAGEVRQQAIRHRYDTDVQEYMRRIEAKTATLLAACCDIGALLGGIDGARRSSLRAYGRLLGLAFQIADDVLDYTGSEDEIGKPIGHDVAEGFATLPLMLAMEDPTVAEKLRRLLESRGALSPAEAKRVVDLVRSSRGPQQALERARELSSEARRQLESIGDGEAAGALAALTTYVVSRKL